MHPQSAPDLTFRHIPHNDQQPLLGGVARTLRRSPVGFSGPGSPDPQGAYRGEHRHQLQGACVSQHRNGGARHSEYVI